jgi:hypothetical protein
MIKFWLDGVYKFLEVQLELIPIMHYLKVQKFGEPSQEEID